MRAVGPPSFSRIKSGYKTLTPGGARVIHLPCFFTTTKFNNQNSEDTPRSGLRLRDTKTQTKTVTESATESVVCNASSRICTGFASTRENNTTDNSDKPKKSQQLHRSRTRPGKNAGTIKARENTLEIVRWQDCWQPTTNRLGITNACRGCAMPACCITTEAAHLGVLLRCCSGDKYYCYRTIYSHEVDEPVHQYQGMYY